MSATGTRIQFSQHASFCLPSATQKAPVDAESPFCAPPDFNFSMDDSQPQQQPDDRHKSLREMMQHEFKRPSALPPAAGRRAWGGRRR